MKCLKHIALGVLFVIQAFNSHAADNPLLKFGVCSHEHVPRPGLLPKHPLVKLKNLNLKHGLLETITKKNKKDLPSSYHMGMKILFISVGDEEASEPSLSLAQKTFLAYGIPYDHYSIKDKDGHFKEEKLPLYTKGGEPRYYGIVLSSGELGYEDEYGNYKSALSSDNWDELAEYESRYRVRRVSLYSYPTDYLGVEVSGGNKGDKQLLKMTKLSSSLDPSVVDDSSIELENAWYYKAKIIDEKITRSFLEYADDSSVAAVTTQYSDGREQLHFFFTQGQWIKASSVIAGTWVNWLTKGVYIGKRRMHLNVQVDDFFLATQLWNARTNAQSIGLAHTHRLSPEDFQAFTDWQNNDFRKQIGDKEFRTEFAFNGQGPLIHRDHSGTDSLFELSKTLFANYFWLSHTYTHANLDYTSYEQTDWELKKNIEFINDLFEEYPKYQNYYSHESMVTPRISGLLRRDSLKAIFDNGIKYVTGDNSRSELVPEHPYVGLYTTEEKNGFNGVLIIPRNATEIYYNASTPAELVSEYNSIYMKSLGSWSSFDDIYKREAERVVINLLRYDPSPYMFHQSNMNRFELSSGKKTSLLSHWMDEVAQGIRKYSKLPITSIKMDDLKDIYLERMAYEKCQLTSVGTFEKGVLKKISFKSLAACKVYVTGLVEESKKYEVEEYGPDHTLEFNIDPSQTVSIDSDAAKKMKARPILKKLKLPRRK